MSAPALYLDSSALVKLVVIEAETEALIGFLRTRPRRVTSDLSFVEVSRSVRRLGPTEKALDQRIHDLFRGLEVLAISFPILHTASDLPPATLRTLDSIHLATALALGDELSGIVTYDLRLAEAALASQVAIFAPR